MKILFTCENNSYIVTIIPGKSRMKGGVLPAYCDPPNPCPAGYTAEDGCIQMEEFENKAEFSRKYQVRVEKMMMMII